MKGDSIANKASTIATGGFSNLSTHDRPSNDYYATDPVAIKLLLELEDFSNKIIWECACGEGHLSKAMIEAGLKVISSDIIDRGYGYVYDFLSEENDYWDGHIITNPPYKYANEFILKAISITQSGNKIAFFLPIRYLEGKERKKIFQQYPPRVVYVSSSRILCALNGDFNNRKSKSGSAMAFAWFIWIKGYSGITELRWFN